MKIKNIVSERVPAMSQLTFDSIICVYIVSKSLRRRKVSRWKINPSTYIPSNFNNQRFSKSYADFEYKYWDCILSVSCNDAFFKIKTMQMIKISPDESHKLTMLLKVAHDTATDLIQRVV